MVHNQDASVRVDDGVAYCGGPRRVLQANKEARTTTDLVLAHANAGDNPPPEEASGASDARSREGKPHTGVWFSTTVIHYTGLGLWTIGFAPHTRSKEGRWEWIHELNTEQAQQMLAENRKCIVRCSTEEVRQILRDCP